MFLVFLAVPVRIILNCGCNQWDGNGYPPAWFIRPESAEQLDSDHSDDSANQSSPMYRLHMASRSYEDQSAMREDIRRINLYINGVKEDYTIVDRLGEGEPQFTSRKSLAH
jgi:hypothetical protein